MEGRGQAGGWRGRGRAGEGMEGKARQKRARTTGQEERRKDGLCNSQQVKVTNIGEYERCKKC